MHRVRTFLQLALLGLAATGAWAQEWRGPASIAVEVKGKPRGKVADALVILRYQQMQPAAGPRPVVTDADGQAVLADLAEGVWEVEVSHDEFLSFVALVLLESGRKPEVQASFLQASGSSLTPIRVKLADGRGRAPSASVPLPPEAAERLAQRRPLAPPGPPVATEPPPRPGRPARAPRPVMPEPELRPLPESAREPETEEPSAEPGQVAAPAVPEPATTPPAPEPEPMPVAEVDEPAPEPEPAPPPSAPRATAAPLPEPASPVPAAPPTPEPPPPAPEPTEPVAPTPEPSPPPPPVPPEPEAVAPPAPAPAPPAEARPPEPEPAPRPPEPTPAPPPQPEPEPEPEPEPAEMPAPAPPAAPELPPAPEPEPEPAIPAPRPEPSEAPAGRQPTATVLPAPGPLGPTLRAYRDRTCVECRPGEFAISVETVVGPSAGPCGESLDEAGRELARLLGGSVALELAELAAPAGEALGRMAASEPSARVVELLGDEADACRLVAAVIPKAGRFRGLRMEAADATGVGDCQADRPCPVGRAHWIGQPRVAREPSANVIWGIFVNQAADRARRARLTVYFAAPNRAWDPPR